MTFYLNKLIKHFFRYILYKAETIFKYSKEYKQTEIKARNYGVLTQQKKSSEMADEIVCLE